MKPKNVFSAPAIWTPHDRAGFSQRWAADRLTLLDIALYNNAGLADLVDETFSAHPEIALVAVKPINGVTFKQLVRTANPTVAFRNANEGNDAKKGTYENRQFNCHIFNPRWEADKAVADSSMDGPAAVIAEAAEAMIEASFQHIGKQFYYGIGNDAKGFPGLRAIVSSTMEVDATGTTDAGKSSCWAVRLVNGKISWLAGCNGDMGFDPEVRVETVYDSSNKPFPAYVQDMTAHIGLAVRDLRAVGRIKNLTSDSGKGLTDNRVAALLKLFPSGMGPTHLLANKTQIELLRQSRITDLLISPPNPTESHGIPIVSTDSIVDGHAYEIA